MGAISTMYLSNSSIIGIYDAGTLATASASFQTIGGIYSGTYSVSHNVIDTTNSTDAGQTSMLLGNTTHTLSFECRYDPTDDGQALLKTLGLTNDNASFKAVKAFMVRPLGTGSTETFTFDGFVTSVSLNPNENDNSVNLSVEVQSSGPSNHTAHDYSATGS